MIQHGIIGRCGSDKRNDSVLRVYEEGEMKKGRTVMIVIAVLALVIEGCVTGGGDVPVSLAVSNLLSLDEAIEAAAASVEARVTGGWEIVVYKIVSDHDEIGEFLSEELNDTFSQIGKLIPLVRDAGLRHVDNEHQFQMTGLVSDDSAVGIGHYLGAKVVITGTFDRYASFSQLQIRAVDVLTSALLASYTARIRNDDPVLAGITENALAYFNHGKDLYGEGKYDEAIQEFSKALAIDRKLANAYIDRGNAYEKKRNYDQVIADYTQAIRIDPNYAFAYNNRGNAYSDKGNYDQAIADYTQAIRIDPNYAFAYNNRGIAYYNKEDYNQVIADYTQAIRLDPNYTLIIP